MSLGSTMLAPCESDSLFDPLRMNMELEEYNPSLVRFVRRMCMRERTQADIFAIALATRWRESREQIEDLLCDFGRRWRSKAKEQTNDE